LFDVGGTLITFDEWRRARHYTARAASVGVNASADDVFKILETLNYELPERSKHLKLSLLPAREQRAFWMDFWAEGFRQIGVSEEDAQRFVAELLDSVNGGNFQKVFDDVVPALEQLQTRGKRLGIISNFSPNCESLLRTLGIARFFDFFIVSGIIGIEKPDPEIFRAAIHAARQPVTELVYIGDSIFHDVEGARNAGMDGILIDRADRFPNFQGTRIRDLREL
jgi:putative hydrolase of the HAD superfamily